ncbi:MAG: AmmeMemoRadiSam system protein B [Alphaproteobacteria bacterium]
METMRPPAVAGSFYDADPSALRAGVEGYLDEARRPSAGAAPKAVIVPHAGYVYSAPVAARAYAAVAALAGLVRRVVLLGPAHFVPFRGIAAPAADAFVTPLGTLPVDRPAVDSLSDLDQVIVDDAPHQQEHSLEVQLPFIQVVLGQVAIVPLVVGSARADEVAEVLEKVWGSGDTLIVISSDLSHYLGYETARHRDTATAAAIEALEASRLGPEDACGCLAIGGLLVVARRCGLRPTRLDLRNSGDTAGPMDHVVGYGAWAFHPAEAGGASA